MAFPFSWNGRETARTARFLFAAGIINLKVYSKSSALLKFAGMKFAVFERLSGGCKVGMSQDREPCRFLRRSLSSLVSVSDNRMENQADNPPDFVQFVHNSKLFEMKFVK